MIIDGIMRDTYIEITENCHNFKISYRETFIIMSDYKDMKPDINQPARLYAIAKTHKNLEGITVANLKFWPILDQTGTFTYNKAKAVSYYLHP